VAAFSLYLTMLDYVDPKEAADYTRWPVLVGRPRLFPPMLTGDIDRRANIRAGDFFSDASDGIRCSATIWVKARDNLDEWIDRASERIIGAVDARGNT